MKANTCEGCSVYTNPYCLCNLDSYKIGCPCKSCLLKMLCQTICEDFDGFSRRNAKERAKNES